MHILFLTENFPPEVNAAATRVFERACYWVEWGHRVTVITSAPNFPQGKLYEGYENRWYQVEEMAGIRVVRVKTYIAANRGLVKRMLDFLSFMVTGFSAGLIQDRPDVVVSTSPQFFTAVAGYMVGALRRLPFVFELGDLWPASITGMGAMKPNLFLRMMEKVELFLYRRSAAVVALTRSFKNDLVARGIKPEKIAVVINGVDLPRYAPRPRDEELAAAWGLSGKFIVGYIGTHGMAHALENVVRAAEHVRHDEQIRFLFVGTGAAKDALVKEAEERGLRNVVFVPPQPKDEMPRWWSLCDIALIHLKNVPVFETVIPSKMFEAMGMGLPLMLAGPAGEASTILTESGAGVYVPGDDPEALAREVSRLAHDPSALKAIADQSLASAPRYSRERQARVMMQALEPLGQGVFHHVPEEVQ